MRKQILSDVVYNLLTHMRHHAGANHGKDDADRHDAQKHQRHLHKARHIAIGHDVIQHPLRQLGNEHRADRCADIKKQRQQHFIAMALHIMQRTLEMLCLKWSFQHLVHVKLVACHQPFTSILSYFPSISRLLIIAINLPASHTCHKSPDKS